MKLAGTKSAGTWVGTMFVIVAAAVFVTVTGGLPATPSDEISRAVSADGAANVKQASAEVFLDAVASLLVAVDHKNSAPYLDAAMKLRPDLKSQIAETATDIYSVSNNGDSDDDRRVSRHRRQCVICHHGYEDHEGMTLHLPCDAARRHLENHPHDTRGPCPENN